MLTSGTNIGYFVMMHKRAGLKISAKGVVSTFLPPGGLSKL